MIHTLRQSPKFVRLLRKLRPLANGSIVDAETVAVGLLERLWHATITGAMRGDIGRYENEVIAEMCGWVGDADLVVQMLVDAGFLDRCKTHRLVVHDWHEHAPKHVKGNVTKAGGFVKAEPLGPGLRGGALGEAPLGKCPPNLTYSNQTKPNQTKQENAASEKPRASCQAFEDWWQEYPRNRTGRRRGKGKCHGLWRKVSESDRPLLMEATRNYAKEAGDFVKDPERFLQNEFWRDYLGEPIQAVLDRVATDDDLASYNPNGDES